MTNLGTSAAEYISAGRDLWMLRQDLYLHLVFLVAKLYLTLSDPMDQNLPDSSVHGVSQTRIREWVAIAFSRGSS